MMIQRIPVIRKTVTEDIEVNGNTESEDTEDSESVQESDTPEE